MVKLDPVERFMNKVSIENGCWNWTAGLGHGGYGRFKLNGKIVGAHRAAFFLFKGPLIPDMVLDHLCRNPRCVNPDHLDQVTPLVNYLRGVLPDKHKNMRSETLCAKGHEFSGDNLYMFNGNRYCKICRREYMQRYFAQKKAS